LHTFQPCCTRQIREQGWQRAGASAYDARRSIFARNGMDLEYLASEFNENGHFNITINTSLMVQIEAVEGYLKSQLVGVIQDRFVVITMPRSNLRIDHSLFLDKQIIVRYLNDGALLSFQSQILDVITKPLPLMFLSYPKVVSSQEIRRYKRVDCFLPSSAQLSGQASNGAILNISRGGCLFVANKPSHNGLSQVDPGAKLGLSFTLTDQQPNGEAQAVVRSHNIKSNMVLLGLEFEEIDPKVQMAIDSFVRKVDEYSSVYSD
jgi:c-di-GMP-binding flagellar brake protein YcgR